MHFNFNQPQLNMTVTSKQPNLVFSKTPVQAVFINKSTLYFTNFPLQTNLVALNVPKEPCISTHLYRVQFPVCRFLSVNRVWLRRPSTAGFSTLVTTHSSLKASILLCSAKYNISDIYLEMAIRKVIK